MPAWDSIINYTVRALGFWLPLSVIIPSFKFQSLIILILISLTRTTSLAAFDEFAIGILTGAVLLCSYLIIKYLSDSIEYAVFDICQVQSELAASIVTKFCLLTLVSGDLIFSVYECFLTDSFNISSVLKIILSINFLKVVGQLILINLTFSTISVYYPNLSLNSELVILRVLILGCWIYFL